MSVIYSSIRPPAGRKGADRHHELSPDQVDRDHALAALARIVASTRFRNAERIRDFLRYVVEETLDGRGALIKAHSIAVDVFRRMNFDDESGDAVVRTSAHRLRLLLEGYYHGEGANESYRIALPKGSYWPRFYAISSPADLEEDSVRTPREQINAIVATPATAPIRKRQSRLFRWLGALLTFLILPLFLATSSHVATEGASDRIHPRIVVTIAPLPGGVSSEMSSALERRLVSDLVSFRSATIVDRAFSDATSGKEGLFNLSVSLAASDEYVADWVLTDTATGSVVWAGEEGFGSLNSPAIERVADSIANSVLGREGALALWSRARMGEGEPHRCLLSAVIGSHLG